MKEDKKNLNNPESHPENPYTILVVEDDEGLNHLIQKALQRRGFHTQGVLRGSEAIAKVTQNPTTLLLLDYLLPDMTAQELIENLIRRGCPVPFIVMTGQGDEKIAVEIMKLGSID